MAPPKRDDPPTRTTTGDGELYALAAIDEAVTGARYTLPPVAGRDDAMARSYLAAAHDRLLVRVATLARGG